MRTYALERQDERHSTSKAQRHDSEPEELSADRVVLVTRM